MGRNLTYPTGMCIMHVNYTEYTLVKVVKGTANIMYGHLYESLEDSAQGLKIKWGPERKLNRAEVLMWCQEGYSDLGLADILDTFKSLLEEYDHKSQELKRAYLSNVAFFKNRHKKFGT